MLLSMKAFQKTGEGDLGAGVEVPAELAAEKERRFQENQFNVVASELISVNRSLPDVRSLECMSRQNLQYRKIPKNIHNHCFSQRSMVHASENSALCYQQVRFCFYLILR
ncbi:hypothetical protein OESDEN_03390 [Oesophagostomum dentatum]|uniref:Uncharacterized protein n=1 Tax=Oesophagostomum dentatum TaxID=61180 RepID=A0A0B1THF5_OESDE|nr:hypothetical protein OESDEN_03390 [Oesophagostomum dentatum]